MEQSRLVSWLLCSLLPLMIEISAAVLSPSGINYEVLALMAIKNELNDPHNVLENWDSNSVDPCSWRMITCNLDGSVSVLGMPSQNLSGTLSPWVGNLTNLQSVLLQNNAISGQIPTAIGSLEKLQTLDLSNNDFSGEIPNSLGGLKNLNYLRLNNNSLTGPCPQSLSNIEGLTLVDLSYNNLSGSLPRIPARTLNLVLQTNQELDHDEKLSFRHQMGPPVANSPPAYDATLCSTLFTWRGLYSSCHSYWSMFLLWAFLLRNKKTKFSCEKSSDEEEETAAERASEVNFADEISGINTGPPSPTSSINY